jgi:hypothetical protein
MKTLGSLLIIAVIAVVGWIGFHAWYVDTHCTMILGTQVCAPLTTPTTTPAAPAPPPQGPPAGATFPAGYPNVACANGQTYIDANGNGIWTVDGDDPQNSPCNR